MVLSNVVIILILVLFGLCLGSFANALVWRVHAQESSKSKKLSILRGRSMCPSCKHELSAADLIPVFSWVILKGRCRYCRASIHWQYPLVEILTAGLFVFSYLYWPYGFDGIGVVQFSLWLVFVTGFMALAIYDLRWMILPDRIIYPLIGLATGQVALLTIAASDPSKLFQAALGCLFSSGIFYLVFQVSGGKWIGGGDVKLGLVIGLIIGGAVHSLLMLFIASLLGTLVAVPLALSKKHKTRLVPFGPFLITATVIVYIFGSSLVLWYEKQFLGM